jgi:hypothetical protein
VQANSFEISLKRKIAAISKAPRKTQTPSNLKNEETGTAVVLNYLSFSFRGAFTFRHIQGRSSGIDSTAALARKNCKS